MFIIYMEELIVYKNLYINLYLVLLITEKSKKKILLFFVFHSKIYDVKKVIFLTKMDNEDEFHLLYFRDDEIDKKDNKKKQVFVTKRINGRKSENKKKKKDVELEEENKNDDKFSFDNEIVIGVTRFPDEKDIKRSEQKKLNRKKHNKKKRKKSKNHSNNSSSSVNKNDFKNNIDNENSRKKSYKKTKTLDNLKLIRKILLVFIILGVIVFAFTTPIFNINNIEVVGNQELVTTNTIKSLSGLKIGQNIFQNNKKDIINSIKENKYIDSVNIRRVLPSTIKIEVSERKIKYQIQLIQGYVYISEQGYILEVSSEKKSVPLLEGYEATEEELLNSNRLASGDLEKLNLVSKILNASKDIGIGNLITSINFENNNNLIIYLESKLKQIYIGDTSNLSDKMLYVKVMIESEEGHSGKIFVDGNINEGFKPYFREE